MAVTTRLEVAPHERDVAGVERHVAAGGQCDAQVGLGQGRSVVDAVAHHRDDATLVLKPPDLRHLSLGEHLGHDACHPGRAGHALGDEPLVSRQEDDVQPHGAEALDRACATWA